MLGGELKAMRRLRARSGALVAAGLLILVSGAAAQEAVEPEVVPEETTEYLHVAGSAFVPMHSDSGVEYYLWGCVYLTGPESSLNYAVVLPEDATVTQLRFYYNDTSATYNSTLRLAEYDDGYGGSYLAEITTTGTPGLTYSTVDLSATIHHVSYSYVLYWATNAAAGNQLQLCGARIAYQR